MPLKEFMQVYNSISYSSIPHDVHRSKAWYITVLRNVAIELSLNNNCVLE